MQELKDLLVNIETARPVDQLTVGDVSKADPTLDKNVEKMVKRGQWLVPGYYEK
ncbi:ATP synthase d subunit [Cladochytrium tenue]|nr:ATP synthase d subunit [Cladochytrium tenue]